MKPVLLLFLLLSPSIVFCQAPATLEIKPVAKKKTPAFSKADSVSPAYIKHLTILTLAAGGGDYYRSMVSLPSGYIKNNTSGFLPLYGRAEYGISHKMSLGATLGYEAFYDNYYKLFSSLNHTYRRNYTDKVTIHKYGVGLFYHLGDIIKVNRLDLSIGVGASINTIHHSATPQSDTMAATVEHTVSPSLRLGVRYYLYGRSAVFLDAGYDRFSTVSVGFSCRFIK